MLRADRGLRAALLRCRLWRLQYGDVPGGGNSHVSAKEGLIQFAVGFTVGAMLNIAVSALMKVAAVILTKIGVLPELAAKLDTGAAKVISMDGHSKQSFLWISHLCS
jgi:hypothetical protein